jgi:hypothetical protein
MSSASSWNGWRQVVLAVAVSVACAGPPSGAVFVSYGPPTPPPVVIPVAPGPRYILVPGHWSWDGARYVWIGAVWLLPPYPAASWIPGRWRHHHRGWYWVPGHWK